MLVLYGVGLLNEGIPCVNNSVCCYSIACGVTPYTHSGWYLSERKYHSKILY